VYKTKDGKWSAVEREIRRSATGPDSQVPRSDDLPSRSPSCSPIACAGGGIDHRSSTPAPSTPSAEGETIAEAGRPGAVTIATNIAGRGVGHLSSAAALSTARCVELAKIGLRPGDEEYEEQFNALLPKIDEAMPPEPPARARRGRPVQSSAPSATSCGASTTSWRTLRPPGGDPGETRFFLSAEGPT